MQYVPFHNLTTPRLLLRKITLSDRESYFRLFSSPEVARYMNWEAHTRMEQTDAALTKLMGRYEAGRCYRWGIALPEENTLMGIIELLKFDEEKGTCAFAYQLAPEYWGRGYGTEALTAAMDFAFGEMGVNAILTDHMEPNAASGAAMKKAGMTYVQTIPGVYRKNGEVYDGILYRITREEWGKRS